MIDAVPSCKTSRAAPEDVVSYLFGLRYRTAADLSYALEYYYDGSGNSEEQQRRFYQCVHLAWETDDESLLEGLPLTSGSGRGPFTRSTPMRRYLHLRAFWNEPFDALYWTPGVRAFYNLADGSYSVAPELSYAGIENLEVLRRDNSPLVIFFSYGGS